MNEKDIKKIVEKSEIKTSLDFTNRLLAEIDKDTPQQEAMKFWSMGQIAIGFLLASVVSGLLVYKISGFNLAENTPAIPLVWSLVLLLVLNHILSLKNYNTLLKRG